MQDTLINNSKKSDLTQLGHDEDRNDLFPIFLKLDKLDTLLVGAGNVGLEKLNAVLKSSPAARVTVVAKFIRDEIREVAEQNNRIRLVERGFRVSDLVNKDLVILATDDAVLHQKIQVLAKKKRVLINVADTPELCDFYLGSIVTKGNLKIGISTNGKSPTIAKRFREFLDEAIPDSTNELLNNMQEIREKIKGSFQEKVDVLNDLTLSWLRKK